MFCLRLFGFYIATCFYTPSTLQVYTAYCLFYVYCLVCLFLHRSLHQRFACVYFCYESLLHFHLRSPVSPSLPVYKGLPAGSVTFQQLNTFPGFFCDDWRRQPGLFALLLFGRTDVQADGWMDLWVSKRKLTPFNKFIYFCVYGIDRRELIRSSTGRLSTAGIYREPHRQLKGCCPPRD